MRGAVAGLALVWLAACQPAGAPVAAVEPVTEPLVADAVPAPVNFPEATGPVANYFKAELPASYVGRWAADAAACAGADVLEVRTQALSFGGETLELGDIEVNESNGQIVRLVAPTDTGARIILRLSTDGAWLNVSAMGTPLARELPDIVGRCP